MAWLLGALLTAVPSAALAGQEDVVLLPTMTPVPAANGTAPKLERPQRTGPAGLGRWARQLDVILGESVQDLGLTMDVSERPSVSAGSLTEDALVKRAKDSWVVSPRLAYEDGHLRLRLLAVAPGSKVVLVRSQEVAPREFEVRAMVMLRDLVQAGRHEASRAPPGPPGPVEESRVVHHARSQGRAVLALNAAVLGGYVGLSLQRASGSSDARLTYPLMALGTGIGLGGSMIVADEWDVGLGDAWYLSAGAIWPTAAGLLLAHSYDVSPASDRYVYGLVGASAGITLGTVALGFKGMGEGGATLTHSGGAFGMLLGGIAQLGYEGRTDATPTRGMGYGTGFGVLLAGTLATQIQVAPSRVLLVDLGGMLGTLTGAAAASPLVFGDNNTKGKDRAWLASMAGGTVAGATVSYFITRPRAHHAGDDESPTQWAALPYGGVIGESVSESGRRSPVLGGGVRGSW